MATTRPQTPLRRLRPPTTLAERPRLVIGALVALVTAFLALYTLRVSQWLVMTDEMQYVKLALGIAGTGSPLPSIRGEYHANYNQLYPLLISPLLGTLSVPDAFRAIHALNALLMASTAMPGYLLARSAGLARPGAYLAAALVAVVPWTALSLAAMTESAAYPAFVWAALAIQRAIAEPSVRRDLLALAAIGLAALARTQFLLLAPVFTAAVVLHELGWRAAARGGRAAPWRRTLRDHAVLAAVSALGVVLLAYLVARDDVAVLVGGYSATVEQGSLLPPGVVHAAEIHLATVVVGIGVVPAALAAAWGAMTLVRPASKAHHALTVLALVTIPLLALQVASFNLRFAGGNTQTRYLFYIAPLLLVGAVLALSAGRRVWVPALGAGVATFFLLRLGTYDTLLSPFFSAPETAFYKLLDGRAQALGTRGTQLVPVAGAAAAVAAALALRFAPQRIAAAAIGLLMLGGLALETRFVLRTMTLGPNGERRVSGTSMDGLDWVDAAVPDGQRAAILPGPVNAFTGKPEDKGYYEQQLWWDVEFWNKTVDRAYADGEYRLTVFNTLPIRLDRATGAVRADDQRPFVARSSSAISFALAGTVVARDRTGNAELLRADRPYSAAWSLEGLDDTGWTGAEPARLRLYPRGGRPTRHDLELRLTTPDGVATREYRLRTPEGEQRGSIAAGEGGVVGLSLCVRRPTDVTLDVPETTPLADGRGIGLRVRRVSDSLADC